MINYGYGNFPIMSYTQLFHSGAIESVEVRMMNCQLKESDDQVYIYDWYSLEEILCKKMYNFCNVLEKNNIPKPYNIFVSILNAKGKKAMLNKYFMDLSKPLPRDMIKSMPAYLNDDSNFDKAIYPLLTSLANSFGLEKSGMYDIYNKPIEEKFDFMNK
mgnify:FL=1